MSTQVLTSPHSVGQSERAAVTLLGSKDMQTNFLTALVRHELGRDCRIQAFGEAKTAAEALRAPLLLLDCQSLPAADMSHFIDEHCASSSRLALLNLQPGAEHERLVQWPQVKGMFYVTVEQPVLINGLKSLLEGGDWLPRHVMQRLIDCYRTAPRRSSHDVKLTRRERQVLIMLLGGSTNLQIADALEVSEYTIKSHLHNLFKKIDVKNRIQAYNWAQANLSDRLGG